MSAHPEAADRVLIAARVHTVSDILPSAEAVAIKGGRIQDVGSAEAIMARAGPGTRVDRLDGKTILPGFVETHTHLLLFGGTLGWVDCRTPPNRSIDDLLERLAERVGATPAGEWVRGWGYDDTLLSDGRHPTRWDLDRVAPEHPVYLAHVSWHSAAVNSRALEMARVGPDAEVADGTLVRDHATGDLTGVLLELGAQELVARAIPEPTPEDLAEMLRAGCQEFLRVGIVSATDAGVGFFAGVDALAAYRRAAEQERLPLSLYGLVVRDYLAAVGKPLAVGRLRVGGMKLWQDGSIQLTTAALSAPYLRQPDHYGDVFFEHEELKRAILEAHRRGFQVAFHTNGDRAIETALDALEDVLAAEPRADHRHRLEHCQLATDAQLQRMARLGIGASFFVNHTYYWGDRHRDVFLGAERARRIDPLRSAAEHGVRFALHSDCPVTPADPLFAMWAATNRLTSGGQPLGPEQRITPVQALRAFTSDAAYLNFEDDSRGSIEPGKQADLVVLSADPLAEDPSCLRDFRVEQTIVAGETAFDLAAHA